MSGSSMAVRIDERVPLAAQLDEWKQSWKAGQGDGLGARIDRELEFAHLLDLLPSAGSGPAVSAAGVHGRAGLTFDALHALLASGGGLSDLDLGPGDRCAIALPEGPELAVCLLAISMRCAAVPMNPWNPEGEIAADLADTGAKAVVVRVGEEFDHVRRAAQGHGVAVIELAPSPETAGVFQVRSDALSPGGERGFNGPDDVALELFTSGTSGRKKLVAVTLQNLCVGAACIAAALELSERDRGYNMMPLFHVGGIVRNLYAPLLAGCGMVYSDGFDPTMFWDELDSGTSFTWYYASPTMHQGVLEEGDRRPASQHRLRFICNAAGDLLPSIAERMRARFDAVILPGYGMTECMPIAIPPIDYQLDRKGASGLILGPQVMIIDDMGRTPPPGVAGRIVLRGAPVARVPVPPPAEGDPVLPEGWFDTGDLGRFDDDGYLYIVGRGKDVIKRGGETIAPGEIEDVLVAHEAVTAAMAFSIPHETLGEAIGAVIVSRAGRRADLDTLTPHLAANLSPAKWPVLLVYMDDLPKNNTGKVLRVGLASRMGLRRVDEKAPVVQRLLEATCPPRGTPISEPIGVRPVEVSGDFIQDTIRRTSAAVTDVFVSDGADLCAVAGTAVDGAELRAALRGRVHDYLVPRTISVVAAIPRSPETGAVDVEALRALLDHDVADAPEPGDEISAFILAQWHECLGPDRHIRLDSDFFDDLGGDSLTAVRIVASIRKEYRIPMPPTSVFRDRTISRLAESVRQALEEGSGSAATPAPTRRRTELAARSQTRSAGLLAQLLPLGLLAPAFRVGQLVAWVFALWYLHSDVHIRGVWALLLATLGVAIVRGLVAPLLAIATKWILVGRYRSRSAPLWGGFYLRWWLVRQVSASLGLGVFALSYPSTALYYRLLGARIGRHTRIDPSADLGEFDLLQIGDRAYIDEGAVLRPFHLDEGAMHLAPVRVGDDVSVGVRATVAPGAALPDGTEVSPLGTSENPKTLNQGTRGLSRARTYAPPLWLKALGSLIKCAVVLGSWVPVLLLMQHLLLAVLLRGPALHHPADLLMRMTSPQRLLVSMCILMVSTVAQPFLYLAGVIVVKWTVVGRFKAASDVARPWPMFERWLIWRLLRDGRFGGVAPLLGSNFSGVSVIYRLLGAKVGKRIYWSGSGHVMTEFDLFECGDDATFGSRSTYLMTSDHGSWPIKIDAGANVADRCVLAPGVTVSRNAVLGSGTFAPEGFLAPAGSTWIGQNGRLAPIELEAATSRRIEAPTLRPYGRAMHLREATYRVWPLGFHVAFNLVWAVFAALYAAAPLLIALSLTRDVLGSDVHGIGAVVAVLVLFFVPLHLVAAAGALGIVIGSKWGLIGHREEGEHFWTDSHYCQRWKLQKVIASISSGWFGGRDVVEFLEGSAYIVWFFRAEGATIGRQVCLYPNGADPMMEEADLLRIGDEACVDQAVLIAHLNTRGEWMTGPIEIGAQACLRTNSRVMMMSSVGDGATILEGSLVLAGDSAGSWSTWRGWPAEAIHYPLGAPPVEGIA